MDTTVLVRALRDPAHAYRRVRHYGFGRLVIDRLKPYPALRWHARNPIRAAKIAADPLGFLERRRLARRMAARSPYADYFPEREAFKVAPPGSFPGIDSVMPAARELYRRFAERFPAGSIDGSDYTYLLFDPDTLPSEGRVTDLRAHPAFQDLATYRPFVEMASCYLGEVPIIGGVDLQVVRPNDRTEGFQRFHMDRVADRQFKIFIAVEDVDAENGATMILPADISDHVARSVGHRFGRIADEVVTAEPWRGAIRHAAGPAGTAFLFDTCRVIHCGARTRSRPRILIMLQYVSKYCHAETELQLGRLIPDRGRIGDDRVDRLLFDLA